MANTQNQTGCVAHWRCGPRAINYEKSACHGWEKTLNKDGTRVSETEGVVADSHKTTVGVSANGKLLVVLGCLRNGKL